MRQYQLKETKEIQKTIKKIVCNKCGREIPFDKSGPQEDFLSVGDIFQIKIIRWIVLTCVKNAMTSLFPHLLFR